MSTAGLQKKLTLEMILYLNEFNAPKDAE
jgi:hypothetical protein